MNDVKFDLNGIQFAEKTTREVESKISDCVYDFEKVCSRIDEQYTTFQSEKTKSENKIHDRISQVQNMITAVERQKSEALQKKQKELSPPQPASIPQNCSQEQRQSIMSKNREEARHVEEKNAEIRKKNREIDEYAYKCDGVIAKLKEIITEMKPLEDHVKKESTRVDGVIKDFRSKAYETKNSNRHTVSTMKTFNYAMSRAYEYAQRIELLNPRAISTRYDTYRQYNIKNTHTHVASASVFSSGTSKHFSSSNVNTTSNSDVDEVVTERDMTSFFAQINGKSKVNMPSANIRRLGGKKFTDKMEEMGYVLIHNDDGSIIDKNGIVHWEKIDD